MEILIKKIKKAKKEIKKQVDKKIKEFKRKRDKEKEFIELSYCLLTANYNAKKALEIEKKINKGFIELKKEELEKRLKELGYRFPKKRAEYIVEARKHIGKIKKDRDWLVKNIKGLGMKEASHFLRNIGELDYAIIDFHIIDILEKERYIKRPKTLTRKKYIEIENILAKIAKKNNMKLGELDLYLWWLETGKIYK